MKVLILFSMIVALVALPALAAQRTAPPVQEPQKPTMDDPVLKTSDGEISKIDTTAKTFTFKGTTPVAGKVFYYDDKTQFTGTTSGIQGLKVGSMVKVSYHEKDGKNWATKVELQPAKKS